MVYLEFADCIVTLDKLAMRRQAVQLMFICWLLLEFVTSTYALNLKGMPLINRILHNYDMAIHPKADVGNRTMVHVNVVVLEMHGTSRQQSEYGLSILLQKGWTDERLAYSPHLSNQPEIYVRSDLYNRFWIPEFSFSNALRMVKGENDLLSATHVVIAGDGNVFMSSRYTLELLCAFDLRTYPHDVHDCYMDIEVHRQQVEDIMINWTQKADVQVQHPVPYISDYELGSVHTANCPDRAPDVCLRAVFRFHHGGAQQWFVVYLPTVILVILSWFSFWLPAAPKNTRLVQVVCCHSMMLLVCHSSSVGLTSVHHVKAADVWVTGGLVFVHATAIECLVAYLLAMRKRHRVWSAPSSRNKDHVRFDANQPIATLTSYLRTGRVQETSSVNCVQQIDKICRIAFPFTYIVFIVIYGVVYKSIMLSQIFLS